MTNIRKYVGIDISSESFDYSFVEDGKSVVGKCSYQEKDLDQFLSKLATDSHCVMEATGIYHLRLATFLHSAGISVSVVNPLVIKRYGQMMLSRTKTDKSDAVLIYNYALTMNPKIWEPAPLHVIEMQQINTCERLLIKERTAFNNQLLGLLKCPSVSSIVVTEIESVIERLNQSIEKLYIRLEEIVNLFYSHEFDLMISIPGVGKKTAIVLLTLIKNFENFENAKQVCSYFGLAPRIFQSGSSVKGKSKICKMGMSHIRQLLYMCARSASRYNKACRELYERLLEQGKPKKLALIAIANKLIKQLFAIVKYNEKYNENYENKFAF